MIRYHCDCRTEPSSFSAFVDHVRSLDSAFVAADDGVDVIAHPLQQLLARRWVRAIPPEYPTRWSKQGVANVIIDNLIADKKIEPMIVVLPNGNATANNEGAGGRGGRGGFGGGGDPAAMAGKANGTVRGKINNTPAISCSAKTNTR